MATPISISDQIFYFEPLIDWSKNRLKYISAWKLAFGRDGYEDRIDWLIGSPLNKTYVLRNEKGSVVAAYSLIRNQIVHLGSITESAICNNVFCIPKYQGLNLFVRISRLSLADSASNYTFAYGFPNPAAIAGHKRVGWQILDDAFNISIKLLNIDKTYSSNVNHPLPVPIEQLSRDRQLEICKQMADIALIKSLSSKKILSIAKSREYIYWRFFYRPKTEDRSYYVLGNADVLMLFSVHHAKNEINILEFQTSDARNESDVLENLVHFAYCHNVRAIKLFGCAKSKLAKSIQMKFNIAEEDVHYEKVNMIVNSLEREQLNLEQSSLPCSMSFLDNDVY